MGINALNVPISVRLIVGDIEASINAEPYLLFGQDSYTVPSDINGLIIAGGDLNQPNGRPIVSILDAANLVVTANVKSNGEEIKAKEIRGNFRFIDQPVIEIPSITDPTIVDQETTKIYAPKSLNGRSYAYNDGDAVIFLHYNGRPPAIDGPATFYRHVLLNGVWYSTGIYGEFDSEAGATDPNTIYVTMRGYEAELDIDDITIARGSLDEVSGYLGGISIYEVFDIEMNFQTPSAGTFRMAIMDNYGDITTATGIFEQF